MREEKALGLASAPYTNGAKYPDSARSSSNISQLAVEDSLELHFDDPRLFPIFSASTTRTSTPSSRPSAFASRVNGTSLRISGAHAEQAMTGKLLGDFYEMLKRGHPIFPSDVEYSEFAFCAAIATPT